MKFIQQNKIKLMTSYILLCMACMNFLKRGSILFFLFVLWTMIGIVLKNKKIILDKSFVFPFFLSLGMIFSSLMYYGTSEIIKSINYIFAFITGYNLIYKIKKRRKVAVNFITASYIGFLIYLFLNFMKNNSIGFNKYQRVMYEYWNGEIIAVTLIGLLCSVIIGYSFYGIIIQKSTKLKIFSILSLGLVFFINIKTATRTPFVLFVCVYLLMGFLYFIDLRRKEKIKIIFLMGVVITLVLSMILNNTFGLRSYVLESPIFKRIAIEGFHTSRNNISENYLSYFFDYIWGGGHINLITGKLAHNFVLEAHDSYGIIATISLIGIIYGFLKNILKMLMIKNKKSIIYLFISMYVSIFIQMCLEPVFEGYPVLVMYFIFLHGIITAYLKKGKIKKLKRKR